MNKVTYKLPVKLDMGPVLPPLCVVLRLCVSEYALYFHKIVDLYLKSTGLIFMMERTQG